MHWVRVGERDREGGGGGVRGAENEKDDEVEREERVVEISSGAEGVRR